MNLLILWFLVSILCGTVHTVAGFGFGIVGLAILQNFSSNIPEMAGTLTIISSWISISNIRYYGIKKVNWKLLLPCLICFMVFQPITNKMIIGMDIRLGRGILGALFIVVTLLSFLPNQRQMSPRWYLGALAGTLSGIFGGLFAIGGPPLAIYFVSSTKDREEYLSTMATMIVCADIWSTTVRILYGIVTVNALPNIGIGLLGMLLGLFFGRKVLKSIPADTFKRIVYLFIGCTGVWYLTASILGI